MEKEKSLYSEYTELKKKISGAHMQNISLFVYDLTDSTNTRAKEYARCAEDKTPAVFVAVGQTAGRGRRTRSFDSAHGSGIYISFLTYPDAPSADAVKMTARASVVLARVTERLTGISPGIKWVNDLYANGKKLAGILTEGEIDSESAKFRYAVVGIGINCDKRDFPEPISNIATSIEDISGSSPDKAEFLKALIEEYFSEDECDFMDEYRRRSTVLGKKITVNPIGKESFFATAVDIDSSGALIVEKEDGTKESLISAEVSIKNT